MWIRDQTSTRVEQRGEEGKRSMNQTNEPTTMGRDEHRNNERNEGENKK
jgi:hypothetical protein